MPTQFFEVSAETKRLLDIGDDVIQRCRAIVVMGAGNQKTNIQTSKGLSSILTGAVQGNPNYVWNHPLKNGGVTAAFGAGNCQDQGALTYTILRSVLTSNEVAAFCVNNSIHHSFATIGDPERDAPSTVVCVDPWPIKAQAVLLLHHFCRKGLQVIWGKARYAKPGGKNADYMSRLKKHAPPDHLIQLWKAYVSSTTFDIDEIIENSRRARVLWHHEWCTPGGVTMAYKVRPRWIPNDERSKCHACKAEFKWNRRRHHCRACGEIFCDDCSKGRTRVGIPATEPGSRPVDRTSSSVRVCATCLLRIQADGLGG